MARILCVDDEPNVLSLKCSVLASAGHAVTGCASAAEAVEKLRHDIYDAVITDWRLGACDGRAVVAAAKARAATPVVVVSGYVAEAECVRPSADLYLEKPVHPQRLVEAVDRLLAGGAAKRMGKAERGKS